MHKKCVEKLKADYPLLVEYYTKLLTNIVITEKNQDKYLKKTNENIMVQPLSDQGKGVYTGIMRK